MGMMTQNVNIFYTFKERNVVNQQSFGETMFGKTPLGKNTQQSLDEATHIPVPFFLFLGAGGRTLAHTKQAFYT